MRQRDNCNLTLNAIFSASHSFLLFVDSEWSAMVSKMSATMKFKTDFLGAKMLEIDR